MSKDNGGPAFPWSRDRHPQESLNSITSGSGMTLRDYFAAHAPDAPKEWWGGDRSRKALVAWRWAYAEDMLKARES